MIIKSKIGNHLIKMGRDEQIIIMAEGDRAYFYEVFCDTEDDIHIHRRENLK